MFQPKNKICLYCGGIMNKDKDFSDSTDGSEVVYVCQNCGSTLKEEWQGEHSKPTRSWFPSEEAELHGCREEKNVESDCFEELDDKNKIVFIVKAAISNNCAIREICEGTTNLCLYNEDVDNIADEVAENISELFNLEENRRSNVKKYNVGSYGMSVAEKLLLNNMRYIARNEDGHLFAYKNKPIKCPSSKQGEGEWTDGWARYFVESVLFQTITWEDTKPTLITDIIHGGKI